MEKIDPSLWRLIKCSCDRRVPAHPKNPDSLVQFTKHDDFDAVTAEPVTYIASPLRGGFIVTLPIPEIESLEDRADVPAVYAARCF